MVSIKIYSGERNWGANGEEWPPEFESGCPAMVSG